jgi:hypothetical protein
MVLRKLEQVVEFDEFLLIILNTEGLGTPTRLAPSAKGIP